jgi:glyoxylase-like metal-dependent hydrolase (beta-lactamase superfamily II)
VSGRHFTVVAGLFAALSAWAETPSWCRSEPRPELAALKHVVTSQPWFDVYEVRPRVFAIQEPRQSQQTISYLIVGSRQAILFDTGMGIGDLRKVTAELTPLPVLVLNSHTHHDHVGGNWQFETVSGMDTEFTRRNALGSRDEAQAEIAAGQVCGDLPPGFDREKYETRAWKIQSTRHDGERIDLGGRTIEIVATPGHTPDAICLLDRDAGLLFTGDTFYPGTVWLYRAETDLDAYQKSLERLAALALDIQLVLGAHSIPTAPAAVLPRLKAAFEEVRSGKIAPTPAGPGRVRYRAGDISFLMRAPAN